MTTDEMILALVKTGKFTLPEGLEWRPMPHLTLGGTWNHFGSVVQTRMVGPESEWYRAAHDLCAMHFARTRPMGCFPTGQPQYGIFHGALGDGDSAAAIAALYEAMK